jgi:adenosine kinase
MSKMLPYIDILFGNEEEAAAFSESFNLGLTNLEEIAIRIARFPKENGKRGRMVIITQGANPTIIVQEGRVTLFKVMSIDPKDIVDTNGAGDAFVGGFLAQLVQGGSIDDCVRSANYAANYIIQQSGCSLPHKANFCREATGGF